VLVSRAELPKLIIAMAELVPKLEQRKAMLEILVHIQEHVAIWPDCLESRVYEAADDSRRILYLELWQSERGLHAHIRSSLYLRLLHVMELASDRPVISFHEVGKTRSIELVEELRLTQ
jgi:quinol monooxygenase YgiN